MIADLDKAKHAAADRNDLGTADGLLSRRGSIRITSPAISSQPYVQAVALPKVRKVRAKFKDLVKPPQGATSKSETR